MKFIVFDFEVFRHDTLLGAMILEPKKEPVIYQTWDRSEMVKFYQSNIGSVWVGHNNAGYDNFILQSIIENKNPYETSRDIIEDKKKQLLKINLIYYDLTIGHITSLKSLEAYDGKNISETNVNFDIMRNLTSEEKLLTENYNKDDLNQTYADLLRQKDEISLRFDIIKEFNLDIKSLSYTEARLAATVLKAHRIENIEQKDVLPIMYPNLRISNKRIIDFYLKREWATGKTINEYFCGIQHKIAAGGIHAGNLCHEKFAYYLDVSGYYNLIMINFNLLPRSIPKEGRELYEFMYHEQLKLKKTNPVKRAVYKTILLAVFGAQNNEYSDFFDPHQGDLVRLTGEMFLVDLLEKLENKVKVIQSNTDGIMIKPINGTTEQDIKKITDEWQLRTKFVLKFEKIYDIVQRDVNNYMYRDESGEIHVKGEALKHWKCSKSPFVSNSYNSKEPLIISKCIVEYYMNGKSPEDTINENKYNIRLFQYICKKLTYDHLEFEDNNHQVEKLQNVNRCFAWNDKNKFGFIYKCKRGKRDKYGSLPDSVFVHNGALDIKLSEKIDYNYYVRRAYERIDEFKIKSEQLLLF